jgi:ABC-type transport system involved in Fe-S cluster assembly fused permease/ATPase subunit
MTILDLLKTVFAETCKSRRHLLSLIFSVVFLILGVGASVMTPLVLKNIIDSFSLDQKPSFIFILLTGYGLLWTLAQVSTHLREALLTRVAERSSRILACHVFQHLYSLPQHDLNKQKTGELTNTIRRAQKNLPMILWSTMLQISPIIIEICVVMLILIKNYSLDLIMVMTISLGIFIFYTVYKTGDSLNLRIHAIEAEKDADNKTMDWLVNLELVRNFGKSKHALEEYNSCLQNREDQEVQFLNSFIGIRIGQTLILGISLTLMTYILGNQVIEKQLSLGDFALFNAYFLRFIGPISVIGYTFKNTKKALLEMKGILEIFTIKPEQDGHIDLHGDDFEIEFRNVFFKYKSKYILKNLSFVVCPRETAVITGPSGSGKSTVFKLLLRIYEPTSGNIFINGIDIRKISLSSLRKLWAIVPQDNALLDQTVADNIAFFDDKVSDQDVENAAKNASIQNSIQNFPAQYKTIVGERGTKLSGGEKQRISLARLFAKSPKICLFDEPTSALDLETEKTVCNNIKLYLSKATKIIISHRLYTINEADKVIRLGA